MFFGPITLIYLVYTIIGGILTIHEKNEKKNGKEKEDRYVRKYSYKLYLDDETGEYYDFGTGEYGYDSDIDDYDD